MWKETRPATEIYFGPLLGRSKPSFKERGFRISKDIVAMPFLGMLNPDPNVIWYALKGLYREHRRQSERSRSDSCQSAARARSTTWKEKVNRKRALIADVLSRQDIVNY